MRYIDEFGRPSIKHDPQCPTQAPGFKLPTLADGTVDMNAPQVCNFARELRAELFGETP